MKAQPAPPAIVALSTAYTFVSNTLWTHKCIIYRESEAQNDVKNFLRDGEAAISILSKGVGGLYIEYPLSTYH